MHSYISFVGEGPTLNSTGITQASQSLGLPATTIPDPGSSEEKGSTPGTLIMYKQIIYY